MKIKNKNGFFLSETLIVIAVVAVVLVSVFGLFASVYSNFKDTEKYNSTNAINAIASINNYITSKEEIDTSVLTPSEPVLDITNSMKYNDQVYSEIKSEFNIKKIYEINMDFLSNDNGTSNYAINLRKYLKTLKNVRGVILLLITENDEFSFIQLASSDPNACIYDGELEVGSEYVNGQYTYRYMQEYRRISSTERNWAEIGNEGWGVLLTDKTSTDPVTTKMCTSINSKPIVSMSYTYFDSQATSIDLSSLDTSKVVNMSNMFGWTKALTLDLSRFDTSNVTNMEDMFSRADVTEIKGLNKLDVSNVTDMSGMFYQSKLEILDLSSFDTSNVTIENMLLGATANIGFAKSRLDAANLNSNTNKPNTLIFITNPETVFEVPGSTVFNGMNNIDSDIKLFNTLNASKDFEISFNLVSADTNQAVKASIMSIMSEAGSPYPGLVYRFHADMSGNQEIAINKKSGSQGTHNLGMHRGVIRIVRQDNKIYYSLNGNNYVLMGDFSDFNNYFDYPVVFGSSLNATMQPFRYFKGTLSDIIIRLEK